MPANANGEMAGAGAGLPTMVELPPSLLPPWASVIVTLLVMMVVLGCWSTSTAKSSVPIPFGGTSGTACRHVVPAGLPVAHDHPALLAAAAKRVATGTVSVTITPVAGPLPTLV